MAIPETPRAPRTAQARPPPVAEPRGAGTGIGRDAAGRADRAVAASPARPRGGPGWTPRIPLALRVAPALDPELAAGGSLYWTPYILGATVYYSSLVTAPVTSLLAEEPAHAVPEIDPTYKQPYGLAAVGSTVYFGYYRNLWTLAVARIPEENRTPWYRSTNLP